MAEIIPVYRVTAGAEFYALFKNASFVYVVYRVKWGPAFGQCMHRQQNCTLQEFNGSEVKCCVV